MLEQYKEDQPVAYRIFMNILRTQRYAHAYLIETNGYDKGLTMAVSFAKLLLCSNIEDGQPICESCEQCNLIDDNNNTELKIINPDGNWIKKEQLLDLQEEFKKKAIIGNKKIYILNQADRLNMNSANSILKFLEEPQEGIVAILVTDNQYQLLDTIISRCQVISLNGQVDVYQEKTTFHKIGQLISHNEEEYQDFLADEKSSEKIVASIRFAKYFEKNKQKMILYMNEYWFSIFSDKDLTSFGIIVLLYFYKDVLNSKVHYPLEIFNEYEEIMKEIADKNTIQTLIKRIEIINQSRLNLDYNANLNLLMDNLVIKMGGV